MIKTLKPIGNSLGLVIDKPILELLKIDANTQLEVTTDGEGLRIRPLRSGHATRVRDALRERCVSIKPEVFQAIALLGLASLACRLSGFFLMRYVSITPRVDAWLRSIPIALIGAILGPVAVNGGPPEWLGLAAAIGLMYSTGNEFVGAVGACAAVAVARAAL